CKLFSVIHLRNQPLRLRIQFALEIRHEIRHIRHADTWVARPDPNPGREAGSRAALPARWWCPRIALPARPPELMPGSFYRPAPWRQVRPPAYPGGPPPP